jgi:deoxyribose-phosphate aldolase
MKFTLASVIEHTYLKPDCTTALVKKLCQDVLTLKMYGVCVPPYFVKEAAQLLGGQAKIVTVVSFPMGYNPTTVKGEECRQAITDGADELDMVVNIAAIKSGQWKQVQNELDRLQQVVEMQRGQLKVIFETALLTHEEITRLSDICIQTGVLFVKTSTGMNGPGATVEAVALLRSLLPDNITIKASGGIATRAFAEELVAAGAGRIGTSQSLAILGF